MNVCIHLCMNRWCTHVRRHMKQRSLLYTTIANVTVYKSYPYTQSSILLASALNLPCEVLVPTSASTAASWTANLYDDSRCILIMYTR